jgi:outer membrane protein assembly factor BamD
MNRRLLLLAVTVLGLAACSGDSDTDAVKPPDSAEKLYDEAHALISDQDYKESVKAFEEVERQHPYSPWAVHAQVMSGYASYKAEDYETAIATLQRFVKLYPDNESTPYAYYLISLCYYEQISDVGRDQKMTEMAMQALREVVRRFPGSEYARDAKLKLDLTTDHLAGKEMQVGRYYLTRDNTLAAINRFRFVVENYQTTTHVPEALHRLVECYLKLGVIDEARRYAAVLGHNYPANQWYRDSYKNLVGKEAAVAKPVPAPAPAPAPTATAAPVEPVEIIPPSAQTPSKPAAAGEAPPPPAPASKPSWWKRILP